MKKFLAVCIALFFMYLFFIVGYYTIQDINATDAKEYFVKKYDLNKFKVFTTKTIEYVYDEDVDCESLWFKKCTNDKDLYKKVYFKYKDETIVIYQFNDGTFEDNYEE